MPSLSCLRKSLVYRIDRGHWLRIVVEDGVERTALKNSETKTAAASDRILGGADNLGCASVGAHRQTFAHLPGQGEADHAVIALELDRGYTLGRGRNDVRLRDGGRSRRCADRVARQTVFMAVGNFNTHHLVVAQP